MCRDEVKPYGAGPILIGRDEAAGGLEAVMERPDPMNTINSKAYWDRRFEGDWQANQGRQQTAFFAHVAFRSSPAWLFDEIRERRLSICDWGCAIGDAARELARVFPDSDVVGYDISETAITEGRQLFPGLQLVAGDLLEEDRSFDVVFSSNTLEHFHDPLGALARLAKRARDYVWLLLPFYDPGGIEEHFARFEYTNLPSAIGEDFVLAFLHDVDVSGWPDTQWMGRQVLLVYARPEALGRIAPRGCEVSAPAYRESFVSPSPRLATRRLADQAMRIGALGMELGAARAALAGQEARLAQAEERRTAEEAAHLAEAEARLLELRARADAAEAEAARVKGALATLTAELERTRQQGTGAGEPQPRLARVEQALSESQAQLTAAAQHIQHLTSLSDELLLRAERAEMERDRMVGSTSWRLTGPLRQAVIRARRIVR